MGYETLVQARLEEVIAGQRGKGTLVMIVARVRAFEGLAEAAERREDAHFGCAKSQFKASGMKALVKVGTWLEALMRHSGEVVSKTDLLDRVWGEDFEGDPNVVEVYIGYLRRKIDRPFGRSDLETVRGEGYRLGSPLPK